MSVVAKRPDAPAAFQGGRVLDKPRASREKSKWMKSGALRGWPTGLAGFAAATFVSTTAAAHGDVDVDRPTVESRAAPAEGSPAAAAAETGETHAEHEDHFMLGLDLVLGWGKVPFAAQNLPTTGSQAITYSRSDQTPSDVQSFILTGAAEVAERLGVEVRLPFTFATFSPSGSESRATTSFGNLELAGEYALPIAPGLRLVGALGVALPTAQGTEIPVGLSQQSAGNADVTGYDRWSLNRAAAFARGFEDDALFEPHRLGIIPKIALSYHRQALSIEPYVKVENLIGTSSTLDASYVGELVAGLRVGYWLHRELEVGLKGWVNVGYAGTSDDRTTAVALEPQVVFRLGPLRPYAGVIIPLAGPPSDNSFVGVQVGLSGTF